MPNHKQVDVYTCTKCGNEYPTYYEAEMCENSPLEMKISPLIEVGDKIHYQKESQTFSRWSYCGEEAEVIHRFLYCREENGVNVHDVAYVVKDGFTGYERVVIGCENDFGLCYISPCEYVYNNGFAEARRIGDEMNGVEVL